MFGVDYNNLPSVYVLFVFQCNPRNSYGGQFVAPQFEMLLHLTIKSRLGDTVVG